MAPLIRRFGCKGDAWSDALGGKSYGHILLQASGALSIRRDCPFGGKKMDKTENRNALIYKVFACPFSVQ